MTEGHDLVPERLRGLGRIHHVAVIVRDLQASLGFYRDVLGLELEVVQDIPGDRVQIALLPVGESKIELVCPTDDTTGVARFLTAKGEGFHLSLIHISEPTRRTPISYAVFC